MTALVLAVVVACIAWTVTHEEVFREVKEYCLRRVKAATSILERKFFYLFTCEYCFSHYVTMLLLFITRYRLLYDGWRGYVIAGFVIVWLANALMGVHERLRQSIKEAKGRVFMLEAQARAKGR